MIMSDKSFMLITALLSTLCVIWALSVDLFAMAMALMLNSLFCFVMAFKIGKMS